MDFVLLHLASQKSSLFIFTFLFILVIELTRHVIGNNNKEVL